MGFAADHHNPNCAMKIAIYWGRIRAAITIGAFIVLVMNLLFFYVASDSGWREIAREFPANPQQVEAVNSRGRPLADFSIGNYRGRNIAKGLIADGYLIYNQGFGPFGVKIWLPPLAIPLNRISKSAHEEGYSIRAANGSQIPCDPGLPLNLVN